MEVLSRLLKKTECNLIRGFHVGAVNFVGMRIFHLLFANDTILFCDASRDQLLSIRLVLSCFRAFMGLKVNVGKSEIVLVGEVNNLDALANILQCRVGSLPMKYLGCYWELLLRQPRFGILFWRKWRRSYLGGSVSIYLGVGGSCY